jgi:hypothetical protein
MSPKNTFDKFVAEFLSASGSKKDILLLKVIRKKDKTITKRFAEEHLHDISDNIFTLVFCAYYECLEDNARDSIPDILSNYVQDRHELVQRICDSLASNYRLFGSTDTEFASDVFRKYVDLYGLFYARDFISLFCRTIPNFSINTEDIVYLSERDIGKICKESIQTCIRFLSDIERSTIEIADLMDKYKIDCDSKKRSPFYLPQTTPAEKNEIKAIQAVITPVELPKFEPPKWIKSIDINGGVLFTSAKKRTTSVRVEITPKKAKVTPENEKPFSLVGATITKEGPSTVYTRVWNNGSTTVTMKD